jgi:hypothetical protein
MWIDEKFLKIKEFTSLDSKKYKSVIDLGARNQILKKFIPTNWEYTGVDKFTLEKNLNIDVERNFDLIKDKYDLVIALDIIEHLNDPINFFNNCSKISKKTIILNIPNVAYYQFRFNFLLRGTLTEKFHFSGNNENDRHRWFTTFENIQDFLKNINSKDYECNIIKIYKSRNKLKFLNIFEKYLGNLFPNIFCWSILLIFDKNEKNI